MNIEINKPFNNKFFAGPSGLKQKLKPKNISSKVNLIYTQTLKMIWSKLYQLFWLESSFIGIPKSYVQIHSFKEKVYQHSVIISANLPKFWDIFWFAA